MTLLTMTEDEIVAAQDKLVVLFAEVHAQTHRALEALAEFDRRQCWAPLAYQSCVQWMNIRLGINAGTARDHLRVAHKLAELPAISASFMKGTLSYSKVRALTRIANAANEAELLTIAEEATAAQLDRLVHACRRISLQEAKEQLAERGVSLHPYDGLYVLKAQLMPDEGARLSRLLDQLTPPPTPDDKRDAAARRADALSTLCDLAFGALQSGDSSVAHRCGATELVVHVDDEVLQDAAADGRCQVEGAHRGLVAVSAETMKRLVCDASVVTMAHDTDGAVHDIGRRTRRLSPALKRALSERDQGCRFPGCAHRIVDVHHVHHWADGGATVADNLLSLCRFHHTLLHEGGFSVRFDSAAEKRRGNARYFAANGVELTLPPRRVRASTTPTTTAGLTPYTGPRSWFWRDFDLARTADHFAGSLAGSDANKH